MLNKGIFKPILSAKDFIEEKIKFPVYCTPKLDGIRSFKLPDNEKILSRSLKPIPNKYIQSLSHLFPNTVDGEFILKNENNILPFNETTSFVMSFDEQPSKEKQLYFVIFDYDILSNKNYLDRIESLKELFYKNNLIDYNFDILIPKEINNLKELYSFEEKCLEENYEGVILRSNGKYKFGRSTVNDGLMIKLKRWYDDEGIIVDMIEKYNNTSSLINELGYKDKNHKKESLTPANTLGSLVLKYKDYTFEVGSGFTDEERDEFWFNKDKYFGKKIKFKYIPYGMVEKPRNPIYLGIRNELDL